MYFRTQLSTVLAGLFVTHCEALVVDELDRRKGKVQFGKVVVSVLGAARGANLGSK